MKKSIFIVAALTAFAFSSTSCRKPRTCTCTTIVGGYTSTYTIVDTKKKAAATCEALTDTYETCTLD